MPQWRRGLVLMSLEHLPSASVLGSRRPTSPPRGTQRHPYPHPAGPRQHSQGSSGAYLLRFLAEQEALVKPELREDAADEGNGAGVGGTVVQPPALQQLGLPSHVLREGIVA